MRCVAVAAVLAVVSAGCVSTNNIVCHTDADCGDEHSCFASSCAVSDTKCETGYRWVQAGNRTGLCAQVFGVEAPDLAMSEDLAEVPDLAMATDAEDPPDLLAFEDLSTTTDDLYQENDLPSPPDIATLPDLAMGPDLAAPPDLLRADIATWPDLIGQQACGGWRGGPNNACWYVAGINQSCNAFCTQSQHGSFDAVGSVHDYRVGAVAYQFYSITNSDTIHTSPIEFVALRTDPGVTTNLVYVANGATPTGNETRNNAHALCACTQ